MECTEEMLIAAVKKAVEIGLLPKYAAGEETYLKNWNGIEVGAIQAAGGLRLG